MLALAFLAALASPPSAAGSQDALQRVVAIELQPAGPVLDGLGPSARVEHTAESSGTLVVWTTSAGIDPLLRVLDRAGTLLQEDDDSGGRPAPCATIEVEPGRELAVLVAAKGPLDRPARLELHLVLAPEDDATRSVAQHASEVLSEARGLAARGEHARMHELLAALVAEAGTADPRAASLLVASALTTLGREARALGDLGVASAAFDEAARRRERALPPDHADLLTALGNAAVGRYETGDVAGARDAFARVLEGLERTLPEGHPDLVRARQHLAVALQQTGDLAGARALEERLVAALEASRGEDDRQLMSVRSNLALTIRAMGEIAAARALQERVLATCERTLAGDHPDLDFARANLADTLREEGELDAARALQEAVLAQRERTLPADHPGLATARLALAATVEDQGDLARARELAELAVAAFERALPDDHPDLASARHNLATTLQHLGEADRARVLAERVLAARERTLPADHPDLLAARFLLGGSLRECGDLAGARALLEQALQGFERTFPADHPRLLASRMSLAIVMRQQGDLLGARALFEQALAGYERTLPDDHPHLLLARMDAANTLREMGDLTSARELQERIVESDERALPEEHPDLASARLNLAATLFSAGELARAKELYERVIDARERTLSASHPDLFRARLYLAATLRAAGDPAGALVVLAAARSALEEGGGSALPASDRDRLEADVVRALSAWEAGDRDGARRAVAELLASSRIRLEGALALAPREARELAAEEARRLPAILLASEGSELEPSVFELAETLRAVSAEAARTGAALATDAEARELRQRLASVRESLDDALAEGRGGGASAAEELARLALERDRLEQALRARLDERAATSVEIAALARELGADSAAIAYRRVPVLVRDAESGPLREGEDHLLAHVVRRDGALARVDLGAAGEIEALAERWRASIGEAVGRGVGVGDIDIDAGRATETDETEAGAALRKRVLDPVLAAAGLRDAAHATLEVCLDDVLHLVPLDALPIAGDGSAASGGTPRRLGDRVTIADAISFAGRLGAPANPGAAPSLLAMGDPSYSGAADDEPGAALAASAPIEASLRSGAPSASFAPLPGTRAEVERVASLFDETFGQAPRLALGERASKRCLHEQAPGARYVHLATHGWFAPETVISTLDAPGGWRMGLGETVAGFAPMTLCGLALAGANQGRDALGRVSGILTAEELCSLDLSACELAVLSACETNVGIRRAGQGIQSLQAALHAAGARTAITSLWKVDDAATSELMERFYAYLWVEKLPKAEALWKAKSDLRAAGRPVRDWAAWVLSGDPR